MFINPFILYILIWTSFHFYCIILFNSFFICKTYDFMFTCKAIIYWIENPDVRFAIAFCIKPIADSYKRLDLFYQLMCFSLVVCQIIFRKTLHVFLVYVIFKYVKCFIYGRLESISILFIVSLNFYPLFSYSSTFLCNLSDWHENCLKPVFIVKKYTSSDDV